VQIPYELAHGMSMQARLLNARTPVGVRVGCAHGRHVRFEFGEIVA
jgi:hypothetical protein